MAKKTKKTVEEVKTVVADVKKETKAVAKKAEVKEIVADVKKEGFLKKTWKYIVTGVTCAAVGVGVTLGADTDRVLETLTESQAKQVAMAAAAYSAEQILAKITDVPNAESKAQAVKDVLVEVQNAMPQFMEAAKASKEVVEDVKEEVDGIKDAIKGDEKAPEQK